jgi:hypothetical protein
MANGLGDALASLAQGFAVILAPGGSVREFVISLSVPDGKEGLTVSTLQAVTEIQQGPIDLLWMTKDDRFTTPAIENQDPVGGLPITDLLTLNIANVTNGPITPPGVPGLLGTLSGTLPIPITNNQAITTPVEFRVRWRIIDEHGNTTPDVTWKVGSGGTGLEGSGGDIFPLAGHERDAITLLFPVLFVEETIPPQVVGERRILASIRLTAGGFSTGWINLPPVTVPLPVVPVPTIIMFFQNKNLDGRVFIVVPSNSPLGSSGVGQKLEDLGALLEPLRGTLAVLGFFIDGLPEITGALDGKPVTFRNADAIPNLDDIVWNTGFINNDEVEDEISSLIMVGPPGRAAELFNDRDYKVDQGQVVVSPGSELFVRITDLHTASPVSQAGSGESLGSVVVVKPPDGRRWGFFWSHKIETFGDELSSLRFLWSS